MTPRPLGDLPSLATMTEVMDALVVSRQTVRVLIDSGELQAIKLGAQWRFRTDAVADYLDGAVVPSQRPPGAA